MRPFLLFLFIGSKFTGAESDCAKTVCNLGDSALRFFLLGDFGGIPVWPYFTPAQKMVASQISMFGKRFNTHFQMELGDNFYTQGVKSVNDERFKTTFSEVYNEGAAMFRPWYIMAGNHDHYGNITAQMDYSKMENRWKYPSLYYQIRYQLNNGVLIEFLVIDTIKLCGNNRDLEFATLWDVWTTESHQPCCPKDIAAAELQWKWLKEKLSKSRADYLFVAGHFPVYSIAEHGPTACLVDRLEPLLHKYKVNAYLSGHDHNLQHLRYNTFNWTVDYILSGAASRADYSTEHQHSVPNNSLKFHYPTGWNPLASIGFTYGGFVYGHIDKTNANFTYYNGIGERLYHFIMTSRKRM